MGLRNAAVRRVGVPDMTTTVLTTTLTGLVSDSALAGGTNPHAGSARTTVLCMFGGALVGAVLVLHAGAAWALGVAAGIVTVTAVFFFPARLPTRARGVAPLEHDGECDLHLEVDRPP